MKKIFLLCFLLLALLVSCQPSASKETVTEPNVSDTQISTEESLDKEGPQTPLREAIKNYSIVKCSEANGAESVLYKTLFFSEERIKLKITENASALPRIEIHIDPEIDVNAYTVEKTDYGILMRVYSKAGVDSLASAFLNFIQQNGETVLSENSVFVNGSYSIESYETASKTAKKIYIAGDTAKSPLTYQEGEEIDFTVSLLADGELVSCPQITWEAHTEDGKTYSGTESGAGGQIHIRIPATGVGFVKLTCRALDEYGNALPKVRQDITFGAGVGVDSIGTDYSEPDDFDAFWEAQVQTLNGVSPDLLSIEHLAPVSGFEILRVKIACTEECGFVTGYITYPQNASPASLPIRMWYNGYGTKDEFANSTPYCTAGHIVFTVFAHSMELGHSASYYSSLNNYGFSGNNSVETCYFRTMILRDLQALRFAKLYFGTEGVKNQSGDPVEGLNLWNGVVKVIGGSQGAFQAFAVTALDHDVTSGYYEVPWMCDVAGQSQGDVAMGSVFRPTYTSVLAYFDTVSFAKRIPATNQVSILMGLGDYTCPPSGIFTLYHQLNCSVSMKVVQGRDHAYAPPESYSETINK